MGGMKGLPRSPASRTEQRPLLRAELPLAASAVLVRGGSDTLDKLRRHAERTARAWALDGRPLLGISTFAVLDMPLDELLRRRFANFRTVYLATAGHLAGSGFSYCRLDGGHISRSGFSGQ